MYNLSNKMYLVSRQVGDLTSTEAKTFSTIHILSFFTIIWNVNIAYTWELCDDCVRMTRSERCEHMEKWIGGIMNTLNFDAFSSRLCDVAFVSFPTV